MKINSIGINKFRSIDKCWLEIENVNALVGKNNVGKSTLLRALNSFFNFHNEKDNFVNGKHNYSPRAIPKIEIVFSNIPEHANYSELKFDDKIHLRLTFYSSKMKRERFQYKKDNRFHDLSIDALAQLNKDVQFVYIPTNRDYRQTVLEEKTILKELLDVYLKRHTEKRNRIKPKVEDAVNYFNKNALQKASRELQKYYPLSSKFEISIDYDSDDIDYHILLRDLCIKIKDEKNTFNLLDTGSGIQSLVNIAIYRLIASMKHSNYILGIEEPEVNLHPQAQKELITEFKRGASEDGIQIFFTTHSAIVIDQLEHNEIISFTKVLDLARGEKTKLNKIPSNFWAKHNLNFESYYQFYQYHNSDFFFSNFVIVVEGKSDKEVVKYLIEKSGYDLNKHGISVLALNGVQDLKYPYYLLKYLSIPYLILVDKDFFLPYLNNNKNESRNPNGFFRYKNEYQQDNLSIIASIITDDNERNELLSSLSTNHTHALDILEKYNMVCMRFNLEQDLIATSKAADKYYDIFNINIESEKNKLNLLTENQRGIKKPENIMKVIKSIENKNLPYTLSRIKSLAIKKIKRL